MSQSRFFDLHIHPILKTLFKNPGNQRSPWQPINLNDGVFQHALSSQASLGQIARTKGMNLVCIPIHAPEMAMMQQTTLQLGSLIYSGEIDWTRIKQLASGAVDNIAVQKEERQQLLRKPTPADGADLAQKKIVLLDNWSTYLNALQNKNPDPDTIYVLLSVEGAHNFYGPGNEDIDTTAMLQRLQTLSINGNPLILYLTPAHLAPNVWLNHAYGMKIFPREKFLPLGNGIPNVPFPAPAPGKTKASCYDLFNYCHKKGILIDIKHMSLRSRRQFFDHRRINFPDRPVLASHVGFTGFSKKQIAKMCQSVSRMDDPQYGCYQISYIRKKGYLPNTYFNPCSIGMYDEDILAVINSGGLIGLSMDSRIMGVKASGSPLEDYEYTSIQEFAELEFQPQDIGKTISSLSTTTANLLDKIEQNAEAAEQMVVCKNPQPELHLNYYMNHILHLCKLGADNKIPDVLNHVCIGSDFDGLISALHCCMNVNCLPDFATQLSRKLPDAAKKAGIPFPMNIDEFIDRLFYRNAFEFISKHYQMLEQKTYKSLL